MSRSAAFLDRDGVINQAIVRDGIPHPPASLEELQILPGVSQGLRTLRAQGFVLIVVTNQPDVARGNIARDCVDEINTVLRSRLCIDEILTCFHADEDRCSCRKPRPGLLLRAARDLQIDLESSFMIGDRWRDVEAGRRAGCKTFYIDRGYAERPAVSYDFRVGSVAEAARIILMLTEGP
jgi:D-glycero-D-manno-heptose 1,7-bisphosphate phosphatase